MPPGQSFLSEFGDVAWCLLGTRAMAGGGGRQKQLQAAAGLHLWNRPTAKSIHTQEPQAQRKPPAKSHHLLSSVLRFKFT